MPEHLLKGGRLRIPNPVCIIPEPERCHATVLPAVFQGGTHAFEKDLIQVIIRTGGIVPIGIGGTVGATGKAADIHEQQRQISGGIVEVYPAPGVRTVPTHSV